MNQVKCFYEYGDGVYSLPIRTRVLNKINEFGKTYEIINISFQTIPPKHNRGTEIYAYVLYKEE